MMKVDDSYYQQLMKDVLNNLHPFYSVWFGEYEYIRSKAGKYLGVTSKNCPCFEYEESILILFTNFPIFGGWMIRPREEWDIQDAIPLKFARHHG